MKMPDAAKLPSRSTLAGRVLGLALILTVAAGSGAVIGVANADPALQPEATADATADAGAAVQPFESSLSVAEAPASSATVTGGASGTPSPAGRKTTGKAASAPALKLNFPSSTGPGVGDASAAAAVKCSRFDDAKITWLMEQVAKTKAENPGMAAGADKLMAALQGALGKNMCASEAQAIIGGLCTDPAVVQVMNKMVSDLPFFIKPMVGNPCSADLVSVLNKVGRYVPGLSSEPS